jgi:hypothetical protein
VLLPTLFFLWTMALFWRSGAVDLFANAMPFVYLTLFNIKNSALRGVLRVVFASSHLFGGADVLKSRHFLFY